MGNMKFLTALVFASRAIAATHHLFTSSLSTPHLYSLEFDDQTNTLIDIANITAHDGHPWISFSYDKANLYAGERNGFASYVVLNSTGLEYNRSISVATACGGQGKDSSMDFVIAELRAPFSVYGAPYGSCGAAVGVDLEGNLQGVVQNVPFASNSRVSGMTLDPENRFLYSADESANGIWTHSVDESGKLTQVAFTPTPRAGSGPRHLVVHPTGKYLYVVLAKSNHVITYAIQSGPNAATEPLKSTTTVYSLLPRGLDANRYEADEIFLSADSNVLFTSTRFRADYVPPPPPPPPPTQPPPRQGGDDDDDDDDRRIRAAAPSNSGFITAILLTSLSEEENPVAGRATGAGFPLKLLFQIPSSTSGGLTNSVSPAPWNNDYFAQVDSETGAVEVWKIENLGTVSYAGAVAQGALSPPTGGWVAGVWVAQGSVVAPLTTTPTTPTPNPGVWPYQGGGLQPQPNRPGYQQGPRPGQNPRPGASPWGPGAGNIPTNQGTIWGPGGNGGGTYQWGAVSKSSDGSQPYVLNSPFTSGGRGNGNPGWSWAADAQTGGQMPRANKVVSGALESEVEGAEEDEDEEHRRSTRSNHEKRQYQATGYEPITAPQEVPVTAKVVARWKSPVGGGTPGRRDTDQSNSDVAINRKHVVSVKPWTGSRKRSPSAPPVDDSYQAEIKAAKEGKSCCANAIWFD